MVWDRRKLNVVIDTFEWFLSNSTEQYPNIWAVPSGVCFLRSRDQIFSALQCERDVHGYPALNSCTEYFWSACAHDPHCKLGENNNCTCCRLGLLSNFADVSDFCNNFNPCILLAEGCVLIPPSARCSR